MCFLYTVQRIYFKYVLIVWYSAKTSLIMIQMYAIVKMKTIVKTSTIEKTYSGV